MGSGAECGETAASSEREEEEFDARCEAFLFPEAGIYRVHCSRRFGGPLRTKTRDTAQLALARSIAERLFTNGSQERAQRLVLTIDKPVERNLGGWGFEPAVDQIYDILVAENA
jgi:hypothetical protein